MDEKGKRLDVNASSLVDLKAELLRKQEEFRRQKLDSTSTFIRAQKTVKKPTVWSKKNVGVLERAQNDVVQKSEETDALEQAKQALEAKAKIYEQMTKGDSIPDEDGSKLFLVDFEQKSLRIMAEKKKAEREKAQAEDTKRIKDEEEERRLLAEVIAPAENPQDEWVDYVDSFGRSRKCLRKDLASISQTDKDKNMSGHSYTVSKTKTCTAAASVNGSDRDLLSEDMKRELQRQEWERQAEEEMERPAGPVHYSDIKFNEKRDHGVGFFQFAQDEETRQQQLDSLKNLRQQTENQRATTERLKEKRKALLQARLAKVKQRKTVQDVILEMDLDPMSSLAEAENDADMIGPMPLSEPEPLVRDDSIRRGATTVREWDKGKKVIYDEQSWLTERRDERQADFAPPSIYSASEAATRTKPAATSQLNTTAQSVWKIRQKMPPTTTTALNKEVVSSNSATDSLSTAANNLTDAVHAGLHAIRTAADGTEQNQANDALSSSYPATIDAFHLVSSAAGIAGAYEPTDNTDMPSASGGYQYTTWWGQPPSSNVSACGYHLSAETGPATSVDSVSAATTRFGHFLSETTPQTVSPFCDPSVYSMAEVLTDGAATVGQLNRFPPCPKTTQSELDAMVEVQLVGSRPAPQPAHFSSAPSLPQPNRMPKYERIFVHDLPPTLPAPPTTGAAPAQYPSQEEIIGPRRRHGGDARTGEISERDAIRNWQRQFDQQRPAAAATATVAVTQAGKDLGRSKPAAPLKPMNIPFASPYIQTAPGTSDKSKDDLAAEEFDPSVLPPDIRNITC